MSSSSGSRRSTALALRGCQIWVGLRLCRPPSKRRTNGSSSIRSPAATSGAVSPRRKEWSSVPGTGSSSPNSGSRITSGRSGSRGSNRRSYELVVAWNYLGRWTLDPAEPGTSHAVEGYREGLLGPERYDRHDRRDAESRDRQGHHHVGRGQDHCGEECRGRIHPAPRHRGFPRSARSSREDLTDMPKSPMYWFSWLVAAPALAYYAVLVFRAGRRRAQR